MKVRKRRKINYYRLLLVIIISLISLSLAIFFGTYFLIGWMLPNTISTSLDEEFNKEYEDHFLFIKLHLETTEEIDTSKPTSKKITYHYKYFFIPASKKINVIVRDMTPPTFVGFKDEVEVYLDTEYTEYQYEVQDNYDAKEDIQVSTRGKVDTSKIGDYYVVYTAQDTSGNKTEKVQKVIVSRKSPLEMSNADFDLTEYFPDVILPKTEDMGDEYMKNIILAGDSVYWNFQRFGIFDASRIWAKPCVGPSNIYDVKVEVNGIQTNYTIPDLIAKNKPKYVILSIGGCECQHNNVETYISAFREFLLDMKENEPDTTIIIETFGPVIEMRDTTYINNEWRNKFNYYTALLCRELDIPVLDIHNLLKDEDGSCKRELCMDDGYHPNVKGMKMIVDYIRNHGYKEK